MGLFSITRKKVAVVSTVAVLGLGGGIAYAYFTGTGSGTGSGAVGTVTTSDIHVIGTETAALLPGGPGGTVSFTAWNTGAGQEKLGTITLSTVTPDTAHSTCDTSVFTMSPVTVGSSGDLAPGGSTPGSVITDTGTLVMADNLANQNNCKNATLTLSFTTS
jgi:hypothetical protein